MIIFKYEITRSEVYRRVRPVSYTNLASVTQKCNSYAAPFVTAYIGMFFMEQGFQNITKLYKMCIRDRSNCYLHSNSLSKKMDNSLLAVRDINHKYIVVGDIKRLGAV